MNIIGGRICKPKRLLYYIEPSQGEIDDFYDGIIPEKLMKYDRTFGTYDDPGLFMMGSCEGQKIVIGIEFRPDDARISYPADLDYLTLPVSYMISSLLPNVAKLDEASVNTIVSEMRENVEAGALYNGMLVNTKCSELVEVFTLDGKNRVIIAVEPASQDDFFNQIVPENEREEELYHLAFHDGVTDHYNWGHIWPRIAGYANMGIQDFSFVHFDVKDFNAINVVYGHGVANTVLKTVVERMKQMDWIYHSARCDNDNFSVMIKDMPEDETRSKLMEFFESIVDIPEVENHRVYYRCGVVPMRNTILLGDRVADAAKQVQRMGNKLYETEVLFYTDSMYDTLDWSTRTRSYLDTAIMNDEFLVYLQPKYDIHTEKICGAEALIRWMYHNRELLAPIKFIPILETGGLISRLDDIVLNKVCEYINKWKAEGLPLHTISVNLSRKSIGNPNLAKHLTEIVDSHGVEHCYIDFELTETSAYDNQEHLIDVIKELKSNGFKISMDDFGTGFSSLSLLGVMPLDTVKIDKSFVDGISPTNDNRKEFQILRHIIAMINDLGITCLAEGAETKAQVDVLRDFGCEIIQGFYYSKPLPVDVYEARIREE